MDRVEQSRRFEEAAREIEADGGLSPIEALEAMDRALSRASPARRPLEPERS